MLAVSAEHPPRMQHSMLPHTDRVKLKLGDQGNPGANHTSSYSSEILASEPKLLNFVKEFQFLLIHASSLSSQKISVVADLIILVSFAVALVYYLISLVSSRLINIFLI